MIEPLYLGLGALLLLAVTVDLLWTTLWVEGGAGPITSLLMSAVWAAFKRVAGDRPRLLSLAGPTILVVGLAFWIGLLWLGWTLLFAGGETALLDTRNAGPISWTERLYFVAYTMFTLGNGDFTPQGGVWQIATSLTAGSGMLFVTLSVTYVLSVLDAVTQKRSFASGVSGLGHGADEILRNAWDGEEFRGLDIPLNELSTQLDTLTLNHKAYPVLHYFHSVDPERSPTVTVVLFDELLTALEYATPEEHRPHDLSVAQARSSVQSYLDTLGGSFVDSADEPPPSFDLDAVREAGVPTVSDGEFADAADRLDDRRRKLFGLVRSDLREWPGHGD